jgi:cobyric acid synthase CobQ/L-threonine-O-3-phosphate decarboxylase
MDVDTFGHGGNLRELATRTGRRPEEILDFSANINPLGPPEWLRAVVNAELGSVVHYPDPHSTELVSALALRHGIDREELLVGNGSTEILYLIPRAVRLGRAVVPVPSYADYGSSARGAGMEVETLLLRESEGFLLNAGALDSLLRGGELVYLCQPNNPTGLLLDAGALRETARRHPSSLFLVDEAFGEFVDGMDSLTRDRLANVIVLLSLTKIYAIPGLRLGCAVADARVAEAVRRIQPPWSVNAMAQAVGVEALRDEAYVSRSRVRVGELRKGLASALRSIPGLTVYPGQANFLLVRLDRGDTDARTLADRMLDDGIAIRVCHNFAGLDKRFFRLAVRTEEENARLCRSLRRALGIRQRASMRPKIPALMFQGTGSNAGKSVLTAALCRILLQDGHRVAPFKAQNMSLNSFVTREGGEMGRAQVVQAQACRLEPDVRMNPVLLKPNSDTGSQVILLGKPVGNMEVEGYVRYKPVAFEKAMEAYDSLAREHDVIVLEGAGSPAEVNLKHHDIVNMRMARHARASVLLVGDIDRGGVFASFVGTMDLLAEWERAMVAGFVVNRFRGKEDLLGDALDYVLRHTGKAVLGVVPYLADLGLPEEDSVSFKAGLFDGPVPEGECVEIAVVDLPHISNFTDFDALRMEPDVRLRIVRSVQDLDRPDAVILPGSKNVPGDLAHLRTRGFHERLRELACGGETVIVGICGGFQMLGARIADPHGLESDRGPVQGLGFLPVETVMALEKTLTRVTAMHLESGLEVRGYEIHHGQSPAAGAEALLRVGGGGWDGARTPEGRIWGTYLHGIFDADEFRRWFVDRLRARRGLPAKGRVCVRYDLEPALDRLADTVRSRLQMDQIYGMLGLK